LPQSVRQMRRILRTDWSGMGALEEFGIPRVWAGPCGQCGVVTEALPRAPRADEPPVPPEFMGAGSSQRVGVVLRPRYDWRMRRALWVLVMGLRWLGLAGVALVCAVWVATWFGEPWVYDRESVYVSAAYGQVIVMNGPVRLDYASAWRDPLYFVKSRGGRYSAGWSPPSPYVVQGWERLRVARWWVEWFKGRGSYTAGPGWGAGTWGTAYDVYVPLWMPLAVCAGFAVLMWRVRVRLGGLGECRACGYDRAGLAAGAVCPECGAGDSTQHRAHSTPSG